ncbi:response regulator transcription factor [Brevibacillus choshinensis]|uniref:response regulator transcription factor n=1 Tax=Brevibacillus choshinensis TaxID=54911 RepID=UPI002E22EBF4|nr:response regulator transcription factor [Brevibacillus choshinensis]MED4752676.1 response regulator transcription factor [Brevibacillus choshinensis]MED4782723.1 response regulator transcription factor [Brevibacillus choshinensis]
METQANILIVDDEEAILQMLKTVLQKEGFAQVDTCTHADQALRLIVEKTYQLFILDVMLPDKSGFELCSAVRQRTNAPIFFLTARGTDFDKLSGFAYGADDYITKPFHPLEVVARMKAHLRRSMGAGQTPLPEERVYDFGRFRVNLDAAELIVDGEQVDCPAQVFQLLAFFCQNPNRVFTKEQIYDHVWKDEYGLFDENTVMVHIHKLRQRIEELPSAPKHLVTVRGLGYKLVSPGRSQP